MAHDSNGWGHCGLHAGDRVQEQNCSECRCGGEGVRTQMPQVGKTLRKPQKQHHASRGRCRLQVSRWGRAALHCSGALTFLEL